MADDKKTLRCSFCGKPVEQVKADSERDHWMIAEEAREYGLVDKVIYKR